MVFNCKECGYKTTTEGGMRLHHIVTHAGEPAEKPSETKPIAKVKDAKPNKPKKSVDIITDSTERASRQLEVYAAMMKKWPTKATNLVSGDKISKKELMKVFPKETNTYINGLMSRAVPLYPKLEPSYIVTVTGMKNDWKAISLVGKRNKITWKEGPFLNKYKIMIPLIQNK